MSVKFGKAWFSLPRPLFERGARCAWGCGTVACEILTIKPRAPCFTARNGAWGRGSGSRMPPECLQCRRWHCLDNCPNTYISRCAGITDYPRPLLPACLRPWCEFKLACLVPLRMLTVTIYLNTVCDIAVAFAGEYISWLLNQEAVPWN